MTTKVCEACGIEYDLDLKTADLVGYYVEGQSLQKQVELEEKLKLAINALKLTALPDSAIHEDNCYCVFCRQREALHKLGEKR